MFVTSTFFAIDASSAAGYIFNEVGGVIEAPNGAGALSLLAIDTTLAPGAMRVDNQGTITGNILGSDGQELILNDGTITGSIALGFGDDLVVLGAGSTLTGDLTLGFGGDILVADTTATLTGLADGGDGDDFLMLILGGTTLTTDRLYSFERVQTFGTGPLDNIDLSEVSQINVGGGGVLDIGSTGFTGEVEVQPGGTIVGLGSLGLLIIRDGGTVSPGNSVGTINVLGPVTFDAGSIFAVEVNQTASDQVLATGAVTINGGTVAVSGENGADLAPGFSPPQYLILSGGVTFDGDAVGGEQELGLTSVLFGVDVGVTPGLAIGGYAGFAGASGEDSFDGDLDQDGYVVAGILRGERGPIHLDAQIGYTNQSFDVRREIAIGGLARLVNSEGELDGVYYAARLSWDANIAGVADPFVEYFGSSLEAGQIAESGASSLDLAVADLDFDRRTLRAGTKLSFDVSALNATIRGGYQRELGDLNANFLGSFAGAPGVFAADGVALSRNAGFATAGLEARLSGRVTAKLEYQGDFGGDHVAHGGAAKVELGF